MIRKLSLCSTAILVLCILTLAAAQGTGPARTRPAPAVRVVNPKVRGNFSSIQAAISSVPDHNTQPVIIEIAPGRYEERLTIPPTKPQITLRGMGDLPGDVWIGGVTAAKVSILLSQAADFHCEHLTLEDQGTPSADDLDHSALYLAAPRQVVEDCNVLGTHNTLAIWAGAQAYLHACRVRGTGDIVYGMGTAVLDDCAVEVTSIGTIATPNTPKTSNYGLVFLDCRFTGPANDAAGLMRPWGEDAHAAFIRCSMDEHLSRDWVPWSGRENTCRAEEFGSTRPDGVPIDLSNRPKWVHILTPTQANRYTVRRIFGWLASARGSP